VIHGEHGSAYSAIFKKPRLFGGKITEEAHWIRHCRKPNAIILHDKILALWTASSFYGLQIS